MARVDDPRAPYKVYEDAELKGTYPTRAEARRAQQQLEGEASRPLLARTVRSAREAAEVQGLAGLGELFDTLVVFETIRLDDRACSDCLDDRSKSEEDLK